MEERRKFSRKNRKGVPASDGSVRPVNSIPADIPAEELARQTKAQQALAPDNGSHPIVKDAGQALELRQQKIAKLRQLQAAKRRAEHQKLAKEQAQERARRQQLEEAAQARVLAEEKRRQEQERKALEDHRREEAAQRKAEQERQRLREEAAAERRRLEEERQKELLAEQQRAEEERLRREAEEEARKKAEAAALEEQRKAEEALRKAEEARRAEEAAIEESRRKAEEMRLQQEKAQKEALEAQKRAEEARKKAEEQAHLAEQQAARAEAARQQAVQELQRVQAQQEQLLREEEERLLAELSQSDDLSLLDPVPLPAEVLKVDPPADMPAQMDVQSLSDFEEGMHSDYWGALSEISLNSELLNRNRIITAKRENAAHTVFDVLRTRLLQALSDNGWRRVAITSAGQNCGKTFTAANLAISLSRQSNCRTILMDCDMRRPSLHRMLGAEPTHSLGDMLRGEIAPEDYFQRLGENSFGAGAQLAFGLNDIVEPYASELLQDRQTQSVLQEIQTKLAPDVFLFDLPPALYFDDVMAFRPYFDGVLLVVGGGVTSPKEIKEVERRLGAETPLLGMVLNMAEGTNIERFRY